MEKSPRRLQRIRDFLVADDGGLRHKTVRSSIWVALGSIGAGSLSFLKTIILARLLTPESFGLMALCMVVVRGIQVLSETGLASALIQRPASINEAKHTVYSFTAIRGLVLGVLLVLLSPYVASLYDQPQLGPLLRVLALSMVFSGLYNINSVVLQKELSFLPLTRLQLVVAILDVAVTSLLAYMWRDVWALVVGQVITAVISVALSFVFLPGRPRFGWNTRLLKELLLYGRFITGLTIVLYVTTEIDNAVIGKILGVEALGIYVLAYMLANLPATHLAKVLARVMFPAYSKLQSNRATLHEAYLLTTRLVAILAFPAAVGLAVLGDEIVRVVYGLQWQSPANVIAVLCVFGAIRSVGSINGYVLNAVGRPNIVFYTNLAKLAMIAVAIVPASRNFGLLGAACAVSVPAVMLYLIELVIFSRVLKLSLARITGAMAPSAITSLAMGFALLLAKHWVQVDSIQWLILAIVGAAAIYSAMNWTRLREALVIVAGRPGKRSK